MSEMLDAATRKALREPFPKELIGKLPATAKRPALDYVGHAAVTDRLNSVVPDWTYTVDQVFDHGDALWLRGTMTIGGVSRVEYGDGKDPKEAIGNFIRRAAMRFGVAIDLWSKEELLTSESLSRTATGSEQGTGASSPPSPTSSGSGPEAEGSSTNKERHGMDSRGGSSAPSELAEAAEGLGVGEESGPKAARHTHTFSAEPFEYDGQPVKPRKGWEICVECLEARKAAA